MAGASVLWLNQAASKVIINKIAIVQGIEPWIMFPQNKAFQLSLSYTNLYNVQITSKCRHFLAGI